MFHIEGSHLSGSRWRWWLLVSEAGWRLEIGPVNSERIGCIGFVGGRMTSRYWRCCVLQILVKGMILWITLLWRCGGESMAGGGALLTGCKNRIRTDWMFLIKRDWVGSGPEKADGDPSKLNKNLLQTPRDCGQRLPVTPSKIKYKNPENGTAPQNRTKVLMKNQKKKNKFLPIQVEGDN